MGSGRSACPPMSASNAESEQWIDDLIRFLCEQPEVGAVRVDPTGHRVTVATLGQVDLGVLEEKLAATIAAVEAKQAGRTLPVAPAGFSVKRDGGAVVVGRNVGSTVEDLWLWREMEWPEI